MGRGDGCGNGHGDGRGGDQLVGILAGSVVACCFLVFMFVIGIPLFIAGVFMATYFKDARPNHLYTPGISCIVVSVIFFVIGIILIVLTCCSGSRSRTIRQGEVVQAAGTTTVVSSATVVQGGYSVQPAVPYPGQQLPPQPYGGQLQAYAGYQQPYTVQPQSYSGQQQPEFAPPNQLQPYYDPNAKPPPY